MTTTWGHILYCLKDSLIGMGLDPKEYAMSPMVEDTQSGHLKIHAPHKGFKGKYEILPGQDLNAYRLNAKEKQQ